ncbi:MAG TPA: UbiX family flavin prenyltransferase [Thermoplasmatales archaeon]|nr:UbiX family flavin prenyltransferase [Thermoplasmatales archaeon]
MRVVVGICGASGVIYGIRLMEELKRRGVEIYLIISNNARRIIKEETSYKVDDVAALSDKCYDNTDFLSPLASGSFNIDAMVVAPCSTKTLSAIANGYADTLISRAALCCLKEGKKLILVPRETPLDLATLRNMVKAKEGGAIILPAMPAFYHKPKSIDDMIDFVVGKILDQLNIEHNLFKRWGSKS